MTFEQKVFLKECKKIIQKVQAEKYEGEHEVARPLHMSEQDCQIIKPFLPKGVSFHGQNLKIIL